MLENSLAPRCPCWLFYVLVSVGFCLVSILVDLFEISVVFCLFGVFFRFVRLLVSILVCLFEIWFVCFSGALFV